MHRTRKGKVGRADLKQKVLLIVPHQDDELFVGGGLFRTLAACGDFEAYVVYMTNGDFFPHEAKVRLREALPITTPCAFTRPPIPLSANR